jgi:hydrogenase nickel incorporation protein HypA/HybF
VHELAVAAHLLQRAEHHADRLEAGKILAINLVVGERSCLVDDALRFSFDLLTPGTVADGARITIRRTPMRFHCPVCESDYTAPKGEFSCPDCKSIGQVLDDGSEMLIESVEIER